MESCLFNDATFTENTSFILNETLQRKSKIRRNERGERVRD